MDQKILREYLIALGFRIDQSGEKKVDGLLTRLDKKATVLGKTLLTVAVSAAVAAQAFARHMEKIYYASRYAETSVGNLQALEYGARNIGLEAGKGAAALKNMTAAIRANPGLIGLLNSLGVEVTGRDKADVLMDLVAALKKMPPYIAQQYAGMFGIDPETLFNMEAGLDKMKEAATARKRMADEMGVDADQAAETAKTYMNMWREVTERAGLFGAAIGALVLPQMQKLAGTTNDLMLDWIRIGRELKADWGSISRDINNSGSADVWKRIREGVTGHVEGGGVGLSPQAKARIGAPMYDIDADKVDPELGHVPRWKRILKKLAPKQFGLRVASDPDAVDTMTKDDSRPMSERQRVAAQRAALEAQAAGDSAPGGTDYASVDDIPARRAQHDPNEALAGDDVSVKGEDQPGLDPKQLLAALEKKYTLPPGLLAKVWGRESHEGDPRFMRSPKGAKGHFGFMPATQKEYGLKDPDDFPESADAAARKWSDLLKRYGGDVRTAAAAYNWGDGNIRRYGLGRAPDETRKYMDAIAGQQQAPVQIEARPEIHIHGVKDPAEAADRVAAAQRTVNADIVRNFSPKVR